MDRMSTQQNRTNGRWTLEEHQKFILGLQLYGKDWKKIEEMVGTRNGAQIRSHAQKFFIKIKKECQFSENEEHSKENQECLSNITNNSKQTCENEERGEYSYFLTKIFQCKVSQKSEFNFWDSLIDQKPKQDLPNDSQPLLFNKRKSSFVALSEQDREETERMNPTKKIKV